MYKIDSLYSVDGQFSDGDYTTGRKGTRVPALWLNTLQNELCNVVTSEQISLDKEDDGQVAKSIDKKLKGYLSKAFINKQCEGNEMANDGFDVGNVQLLPGGFFDLSLTIWLSAITNLSVVRLIVKDGETEVKRFDAKVHLYSPSVNDSFCHRCCFQNVGDSAKTYSLTLVSGPNNPYGVLAQGYIGKM